MWLRNVSVIDGKEADHVALVRGSCYNDITV